MLIKPREEQPKPRQIKVSKKQSICNKCHKSQPYKEITIPIQYGFNGKQSVLIDGVERICTVCGWHVDDVEVSRINSEMAKKKLQEVENNT